MNSWIKLSVCFGLCFSIAGCSSLSGMFGKDADYRKNEAELAKKLEMPPNFVLRRSGDPLVSMNVSTAQMLEEIDTIPSFRAEGIRIESNLVERWLVIEDLSVKDVWRGIEQFLASQGFKVEERRLDIGLLTTEYLARKEIAPVEQELTMISRLLNSWRDEMVDGIYDRYTVRVEEQASEVRVYFSHHMMTARATDTTTAWRLRPYQPMMESLALYRSMLYFGAQQDHALQQINTQRVYQEVKEADELVGLRLAATLNESWDYLLTMQYRANWQVERQQPEQHLLWVKIPQAATADQGFFSRLFGSIRTPGLVGIKLTPVSGSTAITELTLVVEEGNLNPKQRQQILTDLGLLTE
ncbi:outer membrane protein assembly factor BamC [Thiomicrospira microaerophila]|uniref:outer membrane protein assembly factor BamC n=1 Tax=Thiomicrospira microaerophila TaxID=406020 RepID=UPI002010A8D7|nr:outer membrane protein assembly factor BamC [Thiomicrospira microaerophila]UQB43189.1 outer membrane protein assembly factor BamC [Thiomicrospira microaerophila]